MSLQEKILSLSMYSNEPNPDTYALGHRDARHAAAELAAQADARIDALESAGRRVTDAFRALGLAEFPRERTSAKHECEQAMLALDAALAAARGEVGG